MLRLMTTIAVATLLAASIAHANTSPPSAIAAAVANKDRPAEMTALDNGRKPVEVLTFVGLKRGDHVLDVMAGGGYYSEIIGTAVGRHGTVIAQEPMFADAALRTTLQSLVRRVHNVRVLYVMPGELALLPASLDFTIMHLVYHDTYWTSAEEGLPRMDPAAFLERIYAATKPGGIVAVVDHVAAPGGDTREVVDKLHRIDPAIVRRDFAAAGFRFEGASTILANPADDHTLRVFDPAIRGHTDRLVYRFRKPHS